MKIRLDSWTNSVAWDWCISRQRFFGVPFPVWYPLDAGGNPDDWVWGLGGPATELWMDNYCIPAGAPNVEAAHSWINWLLTPEISIKDLQYHGYNSGMKNIDKLIAELAPDLKHADMIFFSDDQVKSMQTGALTTDEDLNGDGHYETAHLFAENLLFATGLQPWKGGVVVTLSGKIVYLRDSDGDHRAADRRAARGRDRRHQRGHR